MAGARARRIDTSGFTAGALDASRSTVEAGRARGAGLAAIGAGIGSGLKTLAAKRQREAELQMQQRERASDRDLAQQRIDNQRLLAAFQMTKTEMEPIQSKLEALELFQQASPESLTEEHLSAMQQARERLAPMQQRMRALQNQLMDGVLRSATGRPKGPT